MSSQTRYSDLAGTTVIGTTTHDYDAAGRQTHLVQKNGSGTILANYTYTFDAADRMTAKTENGTTTSFSYDVTDQITADGATTFGYDATGNMYKAMWFADTLIARHEKKTHTHTGHEDLTDMMDKLIVYPENMTKNLNKLGGLIFSQRVLLALTQAGVSREDSYALVQRNAMKVWEQGKDFLTELLADHDVTKSLKPEEIKKLFDMGYHTKHVDTIFKRVFGS